MSETADILWMDDDLEEQRPLIEIIKKELSATITFASTISVAKSKLDEGDFKIVILDMLIDRDTRGGLTVLRHISERVNAKPFRPPPNVIIYTVNFGERVTDMFPNVSVDIILKLGGARHFIELIERKLRDWKSA
ncbi:MAG TPA: hypothetical protein VN838_03245 [Bradyrhizobium sp.]|nr:hypothetical protein [Bradyrhizobium sp.]